jgi:hypothetical protein
MAMQGQNAINLAEASNPNVFVSGARPFIMWVCGFALFYQYIGFSLIQWIVEISGLHVSAPSLNTDGLVTILLALLGIGTLRTYEKTQGVSGHHG